MRLNLGCGKRVMEGWFNIDAVVADGAPRAPDMLCDLSARIALPDGCAQEVMAIHFFEHLYRWDAESVLADWFRLLRIGGRLIVELPNLVKCCENYLSGLAQQGKNPDQLARWGMYGDPRSGDPFMNHRWGYSPGEMEALLLAAGFSNIRHLPTQFHAAGRLRRDMRVEAIK